MMEKTRGQKLYELFCEINAELNADCDPWESLDPREQLIWDRFANRLISRLVP